MNKNILLYFSLFFIIFSCAVKGPVSKITDQVKRTRFVSEIDDPATRGKIVRITPELTNVTGTIDVSSDGKYLYYSGDLYAGSYNKEIWKLDLEGESLPVRLTSGEGKNKKLDSWLPSLTSDNDYLMYQSGDGIWMIKTDGTGGRVKFPGSGFKHEYYPQVSSNDNVAFFTYANEKGVIWVSDLDGSNLRYLREGTSATWSPNGESLVFVYEEDIWTVNLDGSKLTQITNTPLVSEEQPIYSFDGNKIYFSSNQKKDKQFLGTDDLETNRLEKILNSLKSRNFNIWSIDINGSNLTQLTELDSWDQFPHSHESGLYFVSGRGNDTHILGTNKTRVWKIND